MSLFESMLTLMLAAIVQRTRYHRRRMREVS